jgi:ubiquinol-cytochrome c reductase cytochrome c1 subunit
MVRIFGGLIGLGFVAALFCALWSSVAGVITTPAQELIGDSKYHLQPKALPLASDGVFGKFDRRQLQRGFQVFSEVCSACHSLKMVSFRDLAGLGYTDPEIKAIAKGWKIPQPSINPDTGEVATRDNMPSDHFPSPFANEVAARAANNNALPPDLSLMAKAREGGAPYIYSILTGYQQPSAALKKDFPDFTVPPGLHFNPYFATMNIAMAQQLTTHGQVQYTDGTDPSVNNMARDVSAFLVWAAEPKLEARHAAGFWSVIFLLIAIGLAWGAYKEVWIDVKH